MWIQPTTTEERVNFSQGGSLKWTNQVTRNPVFFYPQSTNYIYNPSRALVLHSWQWLTERRRDCEEGGRDLWSSMLEEWGVTPLPPPRDKKMQPFCQNAQLSRSLESELENAVKTGELRLSAKNLRDFPKHGDRFNLRDTILAGNYRNWSSSDHEMCISGFMWIFMPACKVGKTAALCTQVHNYPN